MRWDQYSIGLLLVVLLSFGTSTLYGQQEKTIITEIFTVSYSEELEQPLKLSYVVQCPMGDASRSGLDFRKVEGYHTSDNEDYKDNENSKIKKRN